MSGLHGLYPVWICAACGKNYGRWPDGHVGTFHAPDPNDPDDSCGWCGDRTQPLTEPRDYGYPRWPL